MQSLQIFQPARNQFVADMSDGDFSESMGLVAGAGNIAVEFFYKQIRLDDPTNPGAHGNYRVQLCVRLRPFGDRYTEHVQMITEKAAMQLYPREYAWFKQNRDVPTDGTPLSELPGITQSQIGILLVHGIRCIEDLVSITADQVSQIGMEARTAYATATKWHQAKATNGELLKDAARDAAITAELESLRKRDADNAATIAHLAAQIEILSKMGIQPGQAVASGAQQAQLMDADTGPDAPDNGLFQGVHMVSGNDDLMGDPQPPVSLPGLDRKRK